MTKQLTALDNITRPASRIGGSILPSSDPSILKPLKGLHGVLQVRPIPEADTYGLFFTHKDGTSCLAQHSNGYSCHNLAVRLVDVWAGKREPAYALAQFVFILNCGGLGMGRQRIVHIAERLPEDSSLCQAYADLVQARGANASVSDLIRKIDLESEALIAVLDHSGSLDGENTQRAAYKLRLAVVQAIGDDLRVTAARESLNELDAPLNDWD